MIEHLTVVEETRFDINRKHDLVDVMFLVINAIMSGAEGWSDIECHRSANGKRTVDTSYHVSSLSPRHKLIGHYIRQHWQIENSQHYILDVAFNEDASRIAMEDAVENMALFRRFVLNIVKQSNCWTSSQRDKMKKEG